jgi:hypothetical protein
MAIVKSPLFSIGASGQLGKSLVYMNWKGIDDVRQHVIPANPRSVGQTTQRGHMTTAVNKWHTVGFNAADKTAFNNWASAASIPMSGFNRFVKAVVDALVAGHTWNDIHGLSVSSVTSSGFTISATGKSGDTYVCYYGLTPSTMNSSANVTNTNGSLSVTLSGLSADTVYYCYIDDTTSGEDARTGIIRQKTAAS